MTTLTESISKLQEFKRSFGNRFGIKRLGIFGSVARQDNTEHSDIDIMVEVEKPTLTLMYELRQALGNLFACKVDLVRMRNSLRPALKENIRRDVVFI